MRVGGRLAGEVAGVELREGSVDVVEVEHDDRRDPLVGVDLDDVEHLGVELPRALHRGRKHGCDEGKALPADRNDGRRDGSCSDVGDRPHVRDVGVSTVSDSRVHDPTAIVDGQCPRPVAPPWRPSRGPRSTPESLVHSACRVFQPRCRRLQFLEPRERGVEVCLVEHLAAVDHVAFDRQKVDPSPLGVEALLRGPMRRVGDDRSEVAQPMHSLDVDAEVRRDVPRTRGCMRSGRRARTLPAAGGRCSPSPVSSAGARAG